MKNNVVITKPATIIVAVFFLLLSLVSWAFASPLGATPDEDYHLTSIWCSHGSRDGLCEEVPGPQNEVTVPTSLVESANCYAFRPELSADCPLKPSTETSTTTRSNADGGYPPVFFFTMGGLASADVITSVLLMRVLNAVLFGAMFLATFLLSPAWLKKPLLWGFLVSVVPLGMFLIPSVNPSSWALISATILWVSLTGFFHAEAKKQRVGLGIVSVVATIMGAGARSDSAVYASIAIVVAIIMSWNAISPQKKLLIFPLLLVVASVSFFLSGGQSSVISPDDHSQTGNVLSLAYSNLILLPQLWTGVLGTWGLGWLDTVMPGIVWVTAVGIYAAFVFSGLKSLIFAKSLSLALVFTALVAIPMYILVNDGVLVGTGVQPRYIYPLVIILAGLSLTLLQPGKDTFSKFQMWVVATGLTVANSIALQTNIRRYISGTDEGGFNLDKKVEWWWDLPFGPMWVWAIGSLCFGIALYLFTSWTNKVWSLESTSTNPGTNFSSQTR